MKIKWRWLKMPIVVWKDISNAAKISWAHLKAVWWLRFLLVTFIVIVVFALWIQFSRTFVKPPDNFGDWIYQFLNDWSVPLSTSVLLLLATAAFLAILDNRNARSIESKERLLNEIIEWANEAARCGYDYPIQFPQHPVMNNTAKGYSKMLGINCLDWTTRVSRVLVIKSSSIKGIASLFKDLSEELEILVDEVTNKLNVVWKEALYHLENYDKVGLPTEKEVKKLRESGENLMTEATRVRLKIMGLQ